MSLRENRIRTLQRYGTGLKTSEFVGVTDTHLANLVCLLPRLEEPKDGLRRLFEHLANLEVPWLEDDAQLALEFGVSERGCKRARGSLDFLRNDRNVNTASMVFGRLKDILRREIALHVRGEPPDADPDRYATKRLRTRRSYRGGRKHRADLHVE